MLAGPIAQGPNRGTLQTLFEGHRWFELRDAIGGQTAPALYLGAVASAFNQTAEAERHLRRAVREAADAERANDAREALANLYMRLGRSADLVRTIDDALAAAPGRSDLRNALKSFESFRRAPDQTARAGRRRPFQCTVRDDGVRLPLIVNGKSVEWLFDTAFSHSAVSESEARLLGIGLHVGTGAAEDFGVGQPRSERRSPRAWRSATPNCATCRCSSSRTHSRHGATRRQESEELSLSRSFWHWRGSGGPETARARRVRVCPGHGAQTRISHSMAPRH